MKSKTNISIKNSLGYRVSPNIIIGKGSDYASGDILDANAVAELIKSLISGGTIVSGEITSADIKDGTIQMEDLSEDVKGNITSSYDEEDQTLYLNGSKKN